MGKTLIEKPLEKVKKYLDGAITAGIDSQIELNVSAKSKQVKLRFSIYEVFKED